MNCTIVNMSSHVLECLMIWLVINAMPTNHNQKPCNQFLLFMMKYWSLSFAFQKPQDNVFVHINPGENYTYRYEICQEQPAGTYWYHPHLHGSTLLQVMPKASHNAVQCVFSLSRKCSILRWIKIKWCYRYRFLDENTKTTSTIQRNDVFFVGKPLFPETAISRKY